MKTFSVESGGNGRFRHETPKVILQILTRLKYTALAEGTRRCLGNKKLMPAGYLPASPHLAQSRVGRNERGKKFKKFKITALLNI